MAAAGRDDAKENENSVHVPCPPPPPVINITHQNNPRDSPDTVANSLSSQIKDLKVQCRNIISDVEHKDCRWLVHNMKVEPKLQRGLPICGLVALNMAVDILMLTKCTSPSVNCCSAKNSYLENDNLVGDVDKLLALAKKSGFSEHGEMYCAENLATLAQEYYGVQAYVQYKGLDEHENVLNHLAQGLPVLVPYDADKNHQPYQERGHCAHWAVVTGFLGCFEDENAFSDWTRFEADVKVPNLYNYYKKGTTCFSSSLAQIPVDKIKTKHLYLLARQGKSQHIGVWSFVSLKESNSNLAELDPKKQNACPHFLVPEGGLKKGLSGKIIYIS